MYLATFFAVLSTAVLPLPEEVTLLGAGYLAHARQGSWPGLFAAALAAIVVGDVGTFLVGRGPLQAILRRRAARRLAPAEWRAWADGLVARHGWRAIVIARFLVGLRGFVYLALGAARQPLGRFVAVDVAVGAVEVGLMIAIGYLVGATPKIEARVEHLDLAAAVVLALALAAPSLVRRLMRRRRAHARG